MENHIDLHNFGRFWCGFCHTVIILGTVGRTVHQARFRHLDAHFSRGTSSADWIELGGNGRPKQLESSGINVRDDLFSSVTLRSEDSIEEDSDSDTSEQHDAHLAAGDLNLSNQEAFHGHAMRNDWTVVSIKTEELDMMDFHMVPSPRPDASRSPEPFKPEQELKYFSVEIGCTDDRRWFEPRDSVEPRYVDNSRRTDELVPVRQMRSSDEPTVLTQLRRTDELLEDQTYNSLALAHTTAGYYPLDEQSMRTVHHWAVPKSRAV